MCPFNIKFAQELKEAAFKPREVVAGKDARTLAEELLAMEQAEFSAQFRKSPMKRAKLAGLQRNARGARRRRRVVTPLMLRSPMSSEHSVWYAATPLQ